MDKKLTILIPHYKTLELTKFCLRSINKYTDLNLVTVIVVDNGSKDESTKYLRTVDWITLIERDPIEGESGAEAHSRALDLALSIVETELFLVCHTDTIVINNDWLNFLLDQVSDKQTAGVGSWKLEHKPPLKRLAKTIERFWQQYIWHPLFRRKEMHIEGIGGNYYYLRSHCAVYKTTLVNNCECSFSGNGEVAGKALHKTLLDKGFKMKFLESDVLSKYIRHLNHATAILNPEIAGKKTGTKKAKRNLFREMKELNYENILADKSLDTKIKA